MKKSIIPFFALLLTVCSAIPVLATNQQLIAGAGPSTKIVQLFVEKFSQNPAANGYQFIVPDRSAKHAGGIKSSDQFLFGRTGRPLTPEERDNHKDEIFLAKVPIAFAVGAGVSLQELSLQQLEAICLGKIANWKELGGPDAKVVLVGREKTEALFSILKEDYPFFRDVEFAKTFNKDHQVVNFLKSPEGVHAISFGAKPNLGDLHIIEVKGLRTGVKVGLVYDTKNQADPLVNAVRDYASSNAWQDEVVKIGLLPVN